MKRFTDKHINKWNKFSTFAVLKLKGGMRARFLAVLMFLLFLDNLPGSAQNDSLSFHTNLYFITANQSFQPHWQVSNRYGIFERSQKNEFVGLFGVNYQYHIGSKFKAESGIEFNLKSDISSSYFQQLYLNLHYGSLQLKFGKEAYTIGQYSDELSAGSLFMSNNSNPLPRLGIGFYNYTPLLFLENYVEFKGVMNFGKFDDNRSDFDGTDDPWYHDAFLYLRSKSLPVNIHAGLNHSVLFGGTQDNGTKIEIDFLATLLAMSSSKIGGGEEINVAGAHYGLYDIGFNWNIKHYHFQIYFQKPFSDGSGMRLNNDDLQLGLLISNNKNALVSSVNYEYINTTHQSGAGIPDPLLNGKLIDMNSIEDFDQYMLDNFDTITAGITKNQFINYLEENLDYGHKYSGRDDPYNNYLYPKGQSYHNYALGNSLNLSKYDMQQINSAQNFIYDRFFINNRIVAHHLAFEGFLGANLSYRAKLTYTDNHGSYAGANKGRYNWGSIEDPEYFSSYYFETSLKQGYSFFEMNYTPFKNKGAKLSSSIAYDFGEMYHNFGFLVGFHFDGFFKISKKQKN